jgi:hypothetical protein
VASRFLSDKQRWRLFGGRTLPFTVATPNDEEEKEPTICMQLWESQEM